MLFFVYERFISRWCPGGAALRHHHAHLPGCRPDKREDVFPRATDVRTPSAHYEWLWSLPFEDFIAFMQEQAWLLEQYFVRVKIKESYAKETRHQDDCLCCGQATFHWELTANNGICEDCDCMLEARYRQLQYDYPYPSGYHCPVSNLPYPP